MNNRPVFHEGQRVRCVDAEASFYRLTEGAIYTVSKYHDDGAVEVDGRNITFMSERFEPVV
jgi:hypothetical protein